MGLSCAGPLTREFFLVVNTTVLHDPGWLNPRMWRANYKLYVDFQLQGGSCSKPPVLFKGQL